MGTVSQMPHAYFRTTQCLLH